MNRSSNIDILLLNLFIQRKIVYPASRALLDPLIYTGSCIVFAIKINKKIIYSFKIPARSSYSLHFASHGIKYIFIKENVQFKVKHNVTNNRNRGLSHHYKKKKNRVERKTLEPQKMSRHFTKPG